MQIGTFRKNVMKTVAVRGAKLGLKVTSRNTNRTNIAHSTVALKADIGTLMQSLSGYVLGQQMTQEMKDDSLSVMGEIGYDLTILCRVLKVKMPSSTKKAKLVGTRTAGLLELDSLATDLLKQVERGVFVAPKMTTVKKMVVLPNKAGAKEERTVEVLDVASETIAETSRQEEMKKILTAIVQLYWKLSYDILQSPPVVAFAHKFGRMKADFPDVEFDVSEGKPKEKKAKVAADKPAEAVAV